MIIFQKCRCCGKGATLKRVKEMRNRSYDDITVLKTWTKGQLSLVVRLAFGFLLYHSLAGDLEEVF